VEGLGTGEVHGHFLVFDGDAQPYPDLLIERLVVVAVAVHQGFGAVGSVRDLPKRHPRHPLSLIEDLLDAVQGYTEAVGFDDLAEAFARLAHPGDHGAHIPQHGIRHAGIGPQQAEDVFVRPAFHHELHGGQPESFLVDLHRVGVPASRVDPSHVHRVSPKGGPAPDLSFVEGRAENRQVRTVRSAPVVGIVAQDHIARVQLLTPDGVVRGFDGVVEIGQEDGKPRGFGDQVAVPVQNPAAEVHHLVENRAVGSPLDRPADIATGGDHSVADDFQGNRIGFHNHS
jgi:hypothetical protein